MLQRRWVGSATNNLCLPYFGGGKTGPGSASAHLPSSSPGSALSFRKPRARTPNAPIAECAPAERTPAFVKASAVALTACLHVSLSAECDCQV